MIGPAPQGTSINQTASEPSVSRALQLYSWMRTARRIDEIERELVARGEAFFQVSGAGHEATAALASLLQPNDFPHCHYRDKALMLARGVSIIEFFNSPVCNGARHSAGRQMSAHLSAPALNLLSLVGPVGNNALQAAGIAREIRDRPGRPIVHCALGDGTTQQGEVLEAIAETVRWILPVLLLVEDNRYAISTLTKRRTFYSQPQGDPATFYGLPIHRVDGSDPLACTDLFAKLVDQIRASRGPAVCVMALERLTDHTNADDEAVYRNPAEMARSRSTADPVVKLRQALISAGIVERELHFVDEAINTDVRDAANAALENPVPVAEFDAKQPLPAMLTDHRREERGDGQTTITMAEALRESLRARMASDVRVTLYGEDIEDPKGDVFGLTRGLVMCQSPPPSPFSALAWASLVYRGEAGSEPVSVHFGPDLTCCPR